MYPDPVTLQTARDRARREVSTEILDTARDHLARYGAAGLSLRAVARDLGLASSSAIYRYFENRDALLTRLIIDAYNALGDIAEQSVAGTRSGPPVQRWTDAAMAIRAWALGHPHEYALLYGTPVPGYAAPQDTVGPGTRVSLALLSVVSDAANDGRLRATDACDPKLEPVVLGDLATLCAAIAETTGTRLDEDVLFVGLGAWVQLFGLISFEMFGQTRGLVSDHAAFFRECAARSATQIGL